MVNAMYLRRSASEGPSSIEVLRCQELSHEYQCHDYLCGDHFAVDSSTRREMLEWVQKVTVYMKFAEDIPVLAATLLDRFLQTPEGRPILHSVADYRLATMGCLYLTAKVHEPFVVVSSSVMSAFSQGMFSAEQVEATELTILKAMKWRANPPTALAFVREFLLQLPCSVSATMKEQAYDHCYAQIQRAVLDYQVFALTEASTIAFFAVQNALQSLKMDSITLGHVAAIFSYSTHTDYYSETETDQEVAIQAALLGLLVEAASTDNNNHNNSKRNSVKRRSKKQRRLLSASSTTKSWTTLSRHMSFDESPCGVARRSHHRLPF